MEVQIKKAVKAGNSSAVILPRAWLDREVRVELVKKDYGEILVDSIKIIRKYLKLEDVIGIYLVGSYARDEEEISSDIDLLAITKNIDKEIIKEGIYNILLVSSKLLKQKLESDLLPVGQMIKEAKPLLNSNYLDGIKVEVTKKNVNWYIKTTKDKLKIIEKALSIARKSGKKNLSDLIAYTLVLRIRTLYIIKKLIHGKSYSKKDFVKLIRNVSGKDNSYNLYVAVKNDAGVGKRFNLDEAERLLSYLRDQLEDVKNLI